MKFHELYAEHDEKVINALVNHFCHKCHYYRLVPLLEPPCRDCTIEFSNFKRIQKEQQ